jgi:hypothetical protein
MLTKVNQCVSSSQVPETHMCSAAHIRTNKLTVTAKLVAQGTLCVFACVAGLSDGPSRTIHVCWAIFIPNKYPIPCNALNLEYKFSCPIFTKSRRYSLFSSCFAFSSYFQSNIETCVHIACKQKSKLTRLLYHAEAYLFCLMWCMIARSSHFDFRLAIYFSIRGKRAVDCRPSSRPTPARLMCALTPSPP